VPACLGRGLFNTFAATLPAAHPPTRPPPPAAAPSPLAPARVGQARCAWASPEGRVEGHQGRPTRVPTSPAERLTAACWGHLTGVRQGGTVLIPADDTGGRAGKSALQCLYVELQYMSQPGSQR
jgi:hypothetical protein